MIEVELPDGSIAEFPDGTPHATIKTALQKRFGSPAKSSGVGLSDFAVSGASFGFGDEVAGAGAGAGAALKSATRDIGQGRLPSLGSMGDAASEAYNRRLGEVRQGMKAYRDENPIASTAAELAGGMTMGGAVSKGANAMAAARPTYPAMIGRGALEGAAYGGAYGFGSGEGGVEDRLKSAGWGAALGAGTGAATGAVGAALARRAANKTVPSTDTLRSQANAAYKTAEQAGVVLEPGSYANAVNDIAALASKEGIDRTIHPKATAALGRLMEEKGNPVDLEKVDTLRRIIGAASKSNDADERRIAGMMMDKLDNYIEGLNPADVVAGDPGVASSALTQGRDLWKRMRKSEVIGDLIEKAKTNAPNFSGSGYENALRTQFRALANNKAKMRSFSDEEQKAIMRVARGGPLENTLRMMGKFAPTGIVSSALGAGIGGAIGGPIGAAAVPAAGFAARQSATALTARNANAAQRLMRAGGQMPAPTSLSPQQQAALQSALMGLAQQEGLFGPRVQDAPSMFR